MTRVFFVRHGSNDSIGRALTGRSPGLWLNDEGRAQAARLASYFAGEDLTAIHCSPSERAQETAEPIGRQLDLPVQIAPALDEIDFGEWTGASFESLRDRPEWQRWNAVRSVGRPPGGETMLQVQARMAGYVARVCEEDGDGRHLLVGHADPIKSTLFHYLGLPLDFIQRVKLSPASITAVDLDEGGPRVLFVNRTLDG